MAQKVGKFGYNVLDIYIVWESKSRRFYKNMGNVRWSILFVRKTFHWSTWGVKDIEYNQTDGNLFLARNNVWERNLIDS